MVVAPLQGNLVLGLYLKNWTPISKMAKIMRFYKIDPKMVNFFKCANFKHLLCKGRIRLYNNNWGLVANKQTNGFRIKCISLLNMHTSKTGVEDKFVFFRIIGIIFQNVRFVCLAFFDFFISKPPYIKKSIPPIKN